MKTKAYSSFVNTCILPPVIYPMAAVLYVRLCSKSDAHPELATKTSLLTLSFPVDVNHLKPAICLISEQILRVSFETHLKVLGFHTNEKEPKGRIVTVYNTYVFKMSW